MIRGRVIWPAYPYTAGFCITDDPDAATFEQIRTVYDFLASKDFVTTKAVWPFRAADRCGVPPIPDSSLRGVTLEDKSYLAYCKMLFQRGFEICLHGASAGNNRRERMLHAFEFLEQHVGTSDTYICHSKNAENMYWEDKITSLFPFNILLKFYSRHASEGSVPSSPYFWGDICHQRINQIRLLRTRSINTLRRNPSMPFFSPGKPMVNGWFSATKRRLADCATQQARDELKRDHGLTVLYQYLHRYADADTLHLSEQFVDAVLAIRSDREIAVDTVSRHLERLRLFQGIYLLHQRNDYWVVNTNRDPVFNLQIAVSADVSMSSGQCTLMEADHRIVLPVVPASSIVQCHSNKPIRFSGKQCRAVSASERVVWTLPMGRLYVNLSRGVWLLPTGNSLTPLSFHLDVSLSGTGHPLLSRITLGEETGLLCDQAWIIMREILFKGRSLDIGKYLDASKEIVLENHDHW